MMDVFSVGSVDGRAGLDHITIKIGIFNLLQYNTLFFIEDELAFEDYPIF